MEIEKRLGRTESLIIIGEFKMIEYVLDKDERNFHCWNYRSLMRKEYVNYIKSFNSSNQNEELIDKFYQKELDYSEKMIQKNFSNYSAWYYRFKILKFFSKDSLYPIDLKHIFKDIDQMVQALYTEPSDQSCWSYHKILLNILSPIQVLILKIDTKKDKLEIHLTLTNSIKKISFIKTNISDDPKYEILPSTKKLKVNIPLKDFSLNEIKLEMKVLCLHYTKLPEIFLSLTFEKVENEYKLKEFVDQSQKENQNLQIIKEVFEKNLKEIHELIEMEPSLSSPMERLIHLKGILYLHFFNPLYSKIKIEEINSIFLKLNEDIEKLKKFKDVKIQYYFDIQTEIKEVNCWRDKYLSLN